MRAFLLIFLMTVFSVIVFYSAFGIFFAQDDFIMIEHFSQNSLFVDFLNAFGPPTETHWRPVDNLYYLISGNIFGKNYFFYHVVIFAIHILTSLLIFRICVRLFKSSSTAFFASFVYLLHPAHFAALFWISGFTINISLFFLTLSIYSQLFKKRLLALLLYLVALLASEAIIVGLVIFAGLLIYRKKFKEEFNFFLGILLTTLTFVIARFLFFSSVVVSDAYEVVISSKTIFALKFYVLRTIGFVEGNGKSLVSVALFLWLFSAFLIFLNNRKDKINKRGLIFALLVFFVGFFPFVLIPNHLSANYMSVAIFGYSMLIGILLEKSKGLVLIMFLIAFFLISFASVRLTKKHSWVVNRSNLAYQLIKNVEDHALPVGSTITFNDSVLATSKEKYIALGGGQAIKFWFGGKNYKSCFSFLVNCPENY